MKHLMESLCANENGESAIKSRNKGKREKPLLIGIVREEILLLQEVRMEQVSDFLSDRVYRL